MRDWSISPAAARDIESILAWSEANFGARIRRLYEALIVQAILDLAKNPDRTGSRHRQELGAAARTYHLWHSRRRVGTARGQIQHPRHFLLFRLRDDGCIEIGRVLHDSMDPAGHLPEDYVD